MILFNSEGFHHSVSNQRIDINNCVVSVTFVLYNMFILPIKAHHRPLFPLCVVPQDLSKTYTFLVLLDQIDLLSHVSAWLAWSVRLSVSWPSSAPCVLEDYQFNIEYSLRTRDIRYSLIIPSPSSVTAVLHLPALQVCQEYTTLDLLKSPASSCLRTNSDSVCGIHFPVFRVSDTNTDFWRRERTTSTPPRRNTPSP